MSVSFFPISTWAHDFKGALGRHYSGSAGAPPGKKLAFSIFEDGERRGWIGLGEPSFKLAPRRRLGLEDARPLPGTASIFMFRLEVEGATPASHILRAFHPLASRHCRGRWGWDVIHWETMVDPGQVRSDVAGMCFRRAGYRSLGMTTGRSARRPPGHTHAPRVWMDATPKLVLYRGPLARKPREPSAARGTAAVQRERAP